MAFSRIVKEDRPPAVDSSSVPPPIFDEPYTSCICPFAQRGLQEKIKLEPFNLENRPSWYKEKVHPPNKVPSPEHNNEVKGESLDLLKYIESNFDGPPLLPEDSAKREFAEELLSYSESFNTSLLSILNEDGIDLPDDTFDYIENALNKFDDGPFFLGDFSLVDVAYAPFIERYQSFLLDVKKYDITEGRPKFTKWIQEMNNVEAYTVTKCEPSLIQMYLNQYARGHSNCH